MCVRSTPLARKPAARRACDPCGGPLSCTVVYHSARCSVAAPRLALAVLCSVGPARGAGCGRVSTTHNELRDMSCTVQHFI